MASSLYSLIYSKSSSTSCMSEGSTAGNIDERASVYSVTTVSFCSNISEISSLLYFFTCWIIEDEFEGRASLAEIIEFVYSYSSLMLWALESPGLYSNRSLSLCPKLFTRMLATSPINMSSLPGRFEKLLP